MSTQEFSKFAIKAPCVTRIGHRVQDAPEVDCLWQCSICGWNPKEKARRLREGKWINGQLHFKGGYKNKYGTCDDDY